MIILPLTPYFDSHTILKQIKLYLSFFHLQYFIILMLILRVYYYFI